MYSSYVVVFQAVGKKKVCTDIFYSRSAAAAKRDFSEVYRNGEYVIIGVLKMPEE